MKLVYRIIDASLLLLTTVWVYWIVRIVPAAQVEAGAWAQKIFYIHVPSAFVSFLGFVLVAFLSGGVLFGDPDYWDPKMKSSLEVSYIFTTIVLLTGPFWAKPVWGIWWRWEPRMTTFFILWLMYGGWFLFRNALTNRSQKQIYSAIYALLAFLNVPLVMTSIYFWKPQNQLHPRDIQLEPIMKLSFYASIAIMLLLFFRLLWFRVQIEELLRKTEDSNWKT